MTARALLVALLLRPGGYLDAGQLISAVWGRDRPTTEDNLYHHISRLRRMLTPLGLGVEPGGWPRSRYRLAVPDSAVDARRFDRLSAAASALARAEPEEALRRLRAAVELWHGPVAFPELRLPGVRILGQRLDMARLDAEVRLAELEIQFGRPDLRLDRLREVAAAHPDHVGGTAALIKILQAVGLTGEAGDLYRQAKRLHGQRLTAMVEPAHGERLHAKQLAAAPESLAGAQVPDQLPAVAGYFTGRTDELMRLTRVRAKSAGVMVSAVNGMAGVGKTALVLRAARQLMDAGRFPDGALFIDLRGFDQEKQLEPATALDSLLHSLGVPSTGIPAGIDARAALYRSVVARRQVLIVLDNARDESQVRPLLPGTACSFVLITSRRKLAGLDDAEHLNIEVLPVHEAAYLFRAMVDTRDPGDEQTNEIVQLCGRLPLAVRIVAARLRTTRTLSAHRLLAQLRTEQSRLNVLDDGERSVRAALAVSVRHLPPEQQAAFATLGLHPGLEFEPYATSALLDTGREHALRMLDALEQVSLADQPTPGRYAFHDLVREYAATTDTGTEVARKAALGRLYNHYARTACRAMDLIYPYETAYRPHPPAEADDGLGPDPPNHGAGNSRDPALAEATAARNWIDAEMGNLLAAANHAANHGRADHTVYQSATLHRHLRTLGKYSDAEALHQHALSLARVAGDDAGELDAMVTLGAVYRFIGRYGPAAAYLSAAIKKARGLGSVVGEVRAATAMGLVFYAQGAHDDAAGSFHRALDLAHASDDRPGQVDALAGLGQVRYLQGRLAAAEECFAQALALARQSYYPPGELDALIGLAYVTCALGQFGSAAVSFERILDRARGSGHLVGELNALVGLGNVHRLQQNYDAASGCYERVLEISRSIGDTHGQLSALNGLANSRRLQGQHRLAEELFEQLLTLSLASGGRNYQLEAHLGLGRTYQSLGNPERALEANLYALNLAKELGQLPDQARALDAVAHAHRALGQFVQAHELWEEALRILSDLGVAITEDVTAIDMQACLDTTPPSPPELS